MSNLNQSPRQRMISLMYLVLMALLALNVSNQVLDGFLLVNESLNANHENISLKLANSYKQFEKDYHLNPAEVGASRDKAQEAKELSKAMTLLLDTIKYDIIALTEDITVDSARNLPLKDIQGKDNFDIPTAYFIKNSTDGSGGKAEFLRKSIEQYKEKMISLIDPKMRHLIQPSLITNGSYINSDNEPQSWEMHNFYYNILVADLAIINNIRSEVRNLEFDIVKLLHESIRAEDYNYDHVNAKVVARSSYVFVGENYEAEIIVSAFDSTQTPEAYYKVGVDSLRASEIASAIKITGSGGKINLAIPAVKEGNFKFAGLIKLRNNMGVESEYPFSDEYIVAKPSLTVSARQMNVLYVGIKNPISISVPGVPRSEIVPVISCGELKPDPNSDDWIAMIPTGYRTANIKVSVKVNGQLKDMGFQQFRVKKLPDPIATIGNKNQGFISKELLKVAGGLEARMPDDFEYNLNFKVKSFIMTTQRGFTMIHATSKNSKITEEMIKNIDMTNRGQNVVFEDIIIEDPSGEERKLAPIVLSIN